MLELKLQRFAENYNTQTTGSAGMTGEMKTFYHDRLLDNAEPKLRHLQFGAKYPISKNGGKTIEFRKYSPLAKATTALQEGVTPDGGELTMSLITATISQYGYFVAISDVLEYAAIDNNIVQATKLLGSQAGRTLDSLCRDELAGGTNVIYAPKGTTEVTERSALDASAILTPDLIYKAAAQLRAMNAETIGDSYVAIAHPYVLYDLMRHEDWIDVHKYARPENIYEGEVGKIGGVRFVDSTEAKIWKDSTCPSGLAVFSTLVIAENAYAVTELSGLGLEHIIHDKRQEGGPLEQRSTVGWKATHVTKRLAEEFMVRIESCSSYSKMAAAN